MRHERSGDMKILLASHSERRRAILSMFGIPFRVAVPEVTEAYTGFPEPDELVMGLACRKARAARALVRPGECIIAADTVVVRGGAVLGKPADRADAFRMLRLLSGSRHQVYTGLAVLCQDCLRLASRKTDVYFRELSEGEIAAYVETGEPLDKAGGYGIQERGAVFVDRIEGDYFNVVGLPVSLLHEMLLADFGLNLLAPGEAKF